MEILRPSDGNYKLNSDGSLNENMEDQSGPNSECFNYNKEINLTYQKDMPPKYNIDKEILKDYPELAKYI